MCVCILATRCARAIKDFLRPPPIQRAQGMPDARCTRDLMRNVHRKCAHEHTGEAENIRHSLRNGFTAYNALSPVNGSFATVASGTHRQLDASTATSGPHAFAVRFGTSRQRRLHVHRIPAPRRDDGRRPSEWDGMGIMCRDFSFW